MRNLPYAEDIKSYWKTSNASPDLWMEKTKKLITARKGKILLESFGNEPTSGRSAFMLAFELQGERFKIIWPVLPSRTGNERAAKIQAVTFMYHDTKAKVAKADVFGARVAFFEYLMLPDGRTTTEVSDHEFMSFTPALFSGNQLPRLTANEDVIDGEFKRL